MSNETTIWDDPDKDIFLPSELGQSMTHSGRYALYVGGNWTAEDYERAEKAAAAHCKQWLVVYPVPNGFARLLDRLSDSKREALSRIAEAWKILTTGSSSDDD